MDPAVELSPEPPRHCEKFSDGEDSDSNSANTLVSCSDETYIFELDDPFVPSVDRSLIDLEFPRAVEMGENNYLNQNTLSVPYISPTETEVDFLENTIIYAQDNYYSYPGEGSKKVAYYNNLKNQTINENEEEIFKMLQDKINSSRNFWSYKMSSIEIETQLRRLTYTDDVVDETEGAASERILEKREFSYNCYEVPGNGISQARCQRMFILSPKSKIRRRSEILTPLVSVFILLCVPSHLDLL